MEDDDGQRQITQWLMCITLVKPELQAHHPALLGHAIMPCRAMPRHASNQRWPAASGQRPAASSQLSSSHNEIPRTGAHHLGVPTSQDPGTSAPGQAQVGMPWHGIARAPDKSLRVLRTPAVPPGTLDKYLCSPHLGTHWKAPCRWSSTSPESPPCRPSSISSRPGARG